MLVVLLTVVIGAAVALAKAPQIKTSVTEHRVAVSVKDAQGRLVTALKGDDFTILEDGKRQSLTQFSNDAAPLSAVILIDTEMAGDVLRSVATTWPMLSQAFNPSDEVATYRFDHFVTKLGDFASDRVAIERSFEPIDKIAEDHPAAADVPAEPLAGKLPDWLSGALRSHAPPPSSGSTPPINMRPESAPPSKVFHDAVFAAAADLMTRDPSRRRIVIVITDGRVTAGSEHTFEQTRDALLREQIQFYGISTADVDQPAMKRTFSILDSYAGPTGGDVYFKGSKFEIEDGFSHIVDQARNEYILHYVSTNEPPKSLPIFRKVVVKASPKFKVAHENGYFQLPQP